jgi:hypothetical protein
LSGIADETTPRNPAADPPLFRATHITTGDPGTGGPDTSPTAATKKEKVVVVRRRL